MPHNAELRAEIDDLKRKLMQVRMAVFTPEYLAEHQVFEEADQTALIDAIVELQRKAVGRQ